MRKKIIVVWLSIIILMILLVNGNVLGSENGTTKNDGDYHTEYNGTIQGSSNAVSGEPWSSATQTFPVDVGAKSAVITVSSDKDVDLYIYDPEGNLVASSATAETTETAELNSSELSLTGEWDAKIYHYSVVPQPYNSAEYHLVIDVYYSISNQKPTITITFPSEGDSITNRITITGTAEDTDGTVQKVEVKIDNGSWADATGTTLWSYQWDTTLVSNSEHTIYARSFDGRDHSTIQSVTVNVNNKKVDGKVGLIPAFELIYLISALSFVLAFKGRKKNGKTVWH